MNTYISDHFEMWIMIHGIVIAFIPAIISL